MARSVFLWILTFVLVGFRGEHNRNGKPVLTSSTVSGCVENCADPEKIKTKTYQNHQLNLAFGVMANCASDEAVIEFSNDTLSIKVRVKPIVQIRKTEHGTDTTVIRRMALCDCFFNVNLIIDSLSAEPKAIMINSRPVRDSLITGSYGRIREE